MRLAWRLALRDLRGAKRGLLIVMLCLGLGVAAVAGIFSLQAALDAGIAENGQSILGGDLELSTGIGPLPASVKTWFAARKARMTETVDFRSILVAADGRRVLVAARATGAGWPMLGSVQSAPAGQFGKNGLLLAGSAADSLGVKPGDSVTLGGVKLLFLGRIVDSPDALADSRLFGAKCFVPLAAVAGSPLLQPTGLVTFSLQVKLAPGDDAAKAVLAFKAAFPGNAWRLRNAGNAAPDVARFLDQAGLFMTLLGLAALLVGGIGVANGVQAWAAARARSIATLRCLGGSARLLWAMHGIQLALLGVPAVATGAAAGAVLPWGVLPLVRGKLPVPAHLGVYPLPLLQAAAFGVGVGFVFALPPLRRAAAITGADLFRNAGLPARVAFSWPAVVVQGLGGLALAGLAMLCAPPLMGAGFCAGAGLVLLVLRGIAEGLMRALRRLPAPREASLALALRRLRGPASTLKLMLLSLGAGLTVLVAVAEIRGNLLNEFSGALPNGAPSFFFLDIQPDDAGKFQAALASTGAVREVQMLPSLRARLLAVKSVPVQDFHPPERSAWPLRSDLGFSYAAAPPAGTKLTAGAWWPADYLGPPEISFDARIAKDWGVGVGDVLTVDVLGRKFDLKIASLRQIDWQSLRLNFLMVGTPDPFAGAPYTLIATVQCDPAQRGRVLAAVTDALPGVTGIDIGEVLAALNKMLREIALAVNAMGLVALLAGVLVLASAIAAEREARVAEAVVLKTLGAKRGQIRRAWLAEFAIAGGCAGAAAALLGTAAAALTVRQVFHTDWHFQPWVMVWTLLGSAALMLVFGYVSTAQALREPAASRLRMESGL